MNYQKVSNETKERLRAYLRSKGLNLQGRGNLKGNSRRQVVSFDEAINIILEKAGF